MKKRLNSRVSLVLAVVLSVGTILYVFYKLDWTSIEKTLAGAHWGWLGLALLVYILNYILRGLRLQIINPVENVSFVDLVAVNGLYGMYNYLLPAKTGELSYIVLVNRRLKLSLVESTASLLVTRYLDFASIAIILPFVLIYYYRTLPAWLLYSSIAFCAVVLALTVGLYWFVRPRPERPAGSAAPRGKWQARIWKVLAELQKGMAAVYQRGEQWRLLILTIFIWLCINANFYLIVLSLGYRLNYFQIIVISIIMIPMTLLPFQGFANLGTHEIGWVAAFSIFGQPEQVALNVAFSSHVILLLFVLILGACSFLVMSLL
ncbi:MAG: lysylphosphatidylglycerol synthase transmembrane domain-containing protein, partial [Bacteroidota bacterium]